MTTRTKIISLIFCLICLNIAPSFAQTQEELSITTYYPSPTANYNELRAKNMAVGDEFITNYSLYCWLVGGCARPIPANTNLAVYGNVGIGTRNAEFKLSLDNDGGIIAKGTFGAGATLTSSGALQRAHFIWYPRKAALRAGRVDGNQWDDANIGDYSVAFGWNTIASGFGSAALGGVDNSATMLYSMVGGGQNNSATANYSSVSGGHSNTASGQLSCILGGFGNTASKTQATVAGGRSNAANGQGSTVGGGRDNFANGNFSTVSGGQNNVATGQNSIISGGCLNQAIANYSIVSGGENNIASGLNAIISGGLNNIAAGDDSWAGGRNMQLSALADRTFVWGYSDAPFTIDTPNAFLIFPDPAHPGNVAINKAADVTYALDISGDLRANSCFLSSDKRLKTNIAPLTNSLAKLRQLRGVYFYWNKEHQAQGYAKNNQRQIGIIAQELETIFPELVSTSVATGHKSVDYGRLTAIMAEAIKELKKEESSLKQRIAALEYRLNKRNRLKNEY